MKGRGRGFPLGVVVGLMLSGLVAGLMAAGNSHTPDKTIAALLGGGVQTDPRLARLPASVRRSLLCVSLAVFMEARGEPDAGQAGVAWVARTRSEERHASLCDVVFAPAQFVWSSDPMSSIVRRVLASPEAWITAQDVAWRVIVLNAPDPTAGANHFWSGPATPAWARAAAAGSRHRIGGHTFIRIPQRRSVWIASL